jgi:hypothetical protein
MKSKKRNPCPMCECDRTHTLSDESAVEIYEFLEAISANFQSRYWPRIERYYAMMANAISTNRRHGGARTPVLDRASSTRLRPFGPCARRNRK